MSAAATGWPRVLGIVGGIGPESTVDYYRQLLAACRAARPGAGAPRLLIHSIDLDRMLALVAASRLDELAAFLASELASLAAAGADLALLASNTPHLVFDELARRSPLPLVSIVAATRDAALREGLVRPGLLGTRFTMEGGFYQRAFAEAGVPVAVPAEEDRRRLDELYFGELVPGIFQPRTRDEVLGIIRRMRDQEGIDGVLLAGTELPLLMRGGEAGLPLLDTSRIHVEAAVRLLLAEA